MQVELSSLQDTERITLTLKQLSEQYGYRAFTMNRMEEYAFYVENRNFLDVENIIVFSDLDGRLMALKPDITLSIVKSAKADGVNLERMYYAENVFRASKQSREFRELRQMGLECIGDVTPYTVVEVLTLAAKSLNAVDEDYSLDVSHLGFVSAVLNRMELDYAARARCIDCIREKNPHDLRREAEAAGAGTEDIDRILGLVEMDTSFEEALRRAEKMAVDEGMRTSVNELKLLGENLGDTRLRLDFSIIPDMAYYDGFVFSGYVKDAPDAVLKGGQYTNLLKRMGKRDGRAIGFALYFDELERYYFTKQNRRPDVFVRYDETTPPGKVRETVEAYIARGKRVLADTAAPKEAPIETTVDLRGEGAK